MGILWYPLWSKLLSSFWGIVFYIRNIILLGLTTKKHYSLRVQGLGFRAVPGVTNGLGYLLLKGYSGDVVLLGSKNTNNMVLGSKYCNIHGIGALKPYYLGPWTLRVCYLTPVSLKANSWTLHCWKFTDCIEPLNSTIYNEKRSRGLGKDSPNPTMPRVETVWGRNSVFAQLKYYKVVPQGIALDVGLIFLLSGSRL